MIDSAVRKQPPFSSVLDVDYHTPIVMAVIISLSPLLEGGQRVTVRVFITHNPFILPRGDVLVIYPYILSHKQKKDRHGVFFCNFTLYTHGYIFFTFMKFYSHI